MSDKIELLPCAFCGAEGATTMRNFSSVGRMDHHYLFCHGCGSCGPTGRNDEEAAKAWSMRPAATHPEIRHITDDELIQFPTNLAALLIAALAEHASEEESELIADANHYFMSAIRATPAAEQPECSGCRGLAAEITALRSGKEYCGACPEGCASCRVCEDSPPVDATEQPDTLKVPRELLGAITRKARNEACREGIPRAGQECTWDGIADMAEEALRALQQRCRDLEGELRAEIEQLKEWQDSHRANYFSIAEERDTLRVEVERLRAVMHRVGEWVNTLPPGTRSATTIGKAIDAAMEAPQ